MNGKQKLDTAIFLAKYARISKNPGIETIQTA